MGISINGVLRLLDIGFHVLTAFLILSEDGLLLMLLLHRYQSSTDKLASIEKLPGR